MPEGLADTTLFGAGAVLVVLAVRWWRPELPWRWAAGHALLVCAFFAVPLATPSAQVPVDIAYQWRPWSETLTEKLRIDNPLLSDIPLQMLPFRTLVRGRLLGLEAPLWAHELGTGQPLLGNAQSAPFAPLHLGTLPVPPIRGLTVAAAWQVLLGLLLTHALVLGLAKPTGPVPGRESAAPAWPVQAGAAVGAIAFALSAYSVAWLYHPLSMVAMWIPGVLLGIVALHRSERGAAVGLVAAAAGLAVSGHPETTAHTAALAAGLGLVLLARGGPAGRPAFLSRAAAAALLAGCLSAPVLLPVLEVLPASERMTLLRSGAKKGIEPPDFRPAALLPLVQPLAFGSPRDADWSGPSNFNEYCTQYAGAAVLAIALAGALALRGRLLAILLAGLGALMVALNVPGIFEAFDALPGLGYAAHGRLRLFWVLAVAVAAGVAVPGIAARPAGRRLGVAALLVVAGVLVLAPPPFGSLHQRLWWWAALAGVAAAAASLAIPRLRRAFPAVLLAAAVADLFILGVRYHALVPPERQLEAPPALAWLVERHREAEEPFRVIANGWDMLPNLPAIYGLWDPRGNDPMRPSEPARVVGKRLSGNRWRQGSHILLSSPADLAALRMLGVRYLLVDRPRRLPPESEVVLRAVGGRIGQIPEALPLFFVPARVRPITNVELARALTLRNRDFGGFAVYAAPDLPPVAHPPVPQEGRVWLREVRPNGFELVTESRTGALVASSVGLVSGWRAAIDGKPAEPVTVNSAFLGLRVPPGVHRVELDYRPRGWVWGLGMFWAAVAGMALWAARSRSATLRAAGSGAP
jgi:hypothetical protein